MEERSEYSVKSAKRNTSKELTPGETLEILHEAIIKCQHAGIDVKATELHHQPRPTAVIVLAGVQLVDGRLVLA